VPNDLVTILVLVGTSAVTFTVARILSRNWRRKRREKEEGARRSEESRQVRRARERRQRGK
jgi:flagellar biosynthesis/type III secretory pathway M-ring protein FliF/YscJ